MIRGRGAKVDASGGGGERKKFAWPIANEKAVTTARVYFSNIT